MPLPAPGPFAQQAPARPKLGFGVLYFSVFLVLGFYDGYLYLARCISLVLGFYDGFLYLQKVDTFFLGSTPK